MKKIVFIIVGIVVLIGAGFFVVRQFMPPSTESTTTQSPVTTQPETPAANIASTPPPASGSNGTIKYLSFQTLTLSAEAATPFEKSEVENIVANSIKPRFKGLTHIANRRIAFAIGPVSLNYDDASLRQMIRQSFEIAEAEDVAVVFHVDDSMFWENRGLSKDPKNVEWLDWSGTPNTGRELDWGPNPAKVAPQMCFTSTAVRKEVGRVAKEVIGSEIKKGIDHLKSVQKEYLFGGVIAGWETQIGIDYATKKYLGYCAITAKGFSASNPPADADREREKIVEEWVTFWAKNLADAGVDTKKIYSHITIGQSREQLEFMKKANPSLGTYSELVHFAPRTVAFGQYRNPGFSLYGFPDPALYDEIKNHGSPPWAISEGDTDFSEGNTYASWEKFLGSLFNHGATLVNIFPPGSDSKEAIAAYNKFLNGEKLSEGK